MSSIHLERLRKVYPGGRTAVEGVDLTIADGELVVLVGPSGCGKTTLLRLVAGLEEPTAGRVVLGDRDVTDVPPQDRDLAMVFQSYALYPHMTVRKNLAFGLRMRRAAHDRIGERVRETARLLGLEPLLDERPARLSGGQRQRVALGRAIVREPEAFLLDEPLSNLDVQLRVRTRAEIARLHRHLGATMLYVTHDQEEAMTLGDRIAVMREGRIEQVAPPMDVYRRPVSAFVAGFIGSPTMNFFHGVLLEDGERVRLDGLAEPLRLEGPPVAGSRRREILLGIRPQDLEVTGPGGFDFEARVEVIEPLGSEHRAHLDIGGHGETRLTVVVSPDVPIDVGESLGLRLRRDRIHLFGADGGGRLN